MHKIYIKKIRVKNQSLPRISLKMKNCKSVNDYFERICNNAKVSMSLISLKPTINIEKIEEKPLEKISVLTPEDLNSIAGRFKTDMGD